MSDTAAADMIGPVDGGPSLSWKTTGTVMSILDRILRADIVCEGLENLTTRPRLYVVNHFTRFETFILPYMLYKHTGTAVRSLAYHQLFNGKLGDYLRSLGAVSTKHPRKNRLIIGDLLTGRHDWVIFPEGAMMKNKQVVDRGRYWLRHPRREGPPHTGAAVMALKTQFARRAYRRALRDGHTEVTSHYEQRYGMTGENSLAEHDLCIVPVTITYYPLRPRHNLLSKVAEFFFRELPPNVLEELVVEGQLLLSDSDITVYFGNPLPVDQYVQPLMQLALMLPGRADISRRSDMLAGMQCKRLTRRFMCKIYTQTTINIDHLVCGALRYASRDEFPVADLHRSLYLAARRVRTLSDRRLHESLRNKLVTVLTDDTHPPLEDILQLAESDGVISRFGDTLRIDRSALSDTHTFDDVRVKNTVSVIANELLPLARVTQIIKETVNYSPAELRRRTLDASIARDLEQFDYAYGRYYRGDLSKEKEIGRPFFLRGSKGGAGIVLSHGYLSAPAEVRALAESLHQRGFSVYGVRLEGHGTAPHHIGDVSWQDWLHSYYRGYAVIRNYCSDIVLGGFSTGGLLSLVAASRMGPCVRGVFAINASLRLKDIRTRVVGPVMLWNELLSKFGHEDSVREYVDHHSENPHINYSQNYIHGVRELQRLIDTCEDRLASVESPALIVQGRNDPAVFARSAELIHKGLRSASKQLEWMEFDRHVIIQNEGRESVFRVIGDFVQSLPFTALHS